MDAERRQALLRGIAIALFACSFSGFCGYLWVDANLNPRPYATDSLRTYLAAVQAGDWAAATARYDTGTPDLTQERLREGWGRCAAARGAIVGFAVRGTFFAPGTAIATIRFADGTTDEWQPTMTPRRSPGWRLTAPLPPSCARYA